MLHCSFHDALQFCRLENPRCRNSVMQRHRDLGSTFALTRNSRKLLIHSDPARKQVSLTWPSACSIGDRTKVATRLDALARASPLSSSGGREQI